MRRIIYQLPNGLIAIDTPVKNDFGDEKFTDEQIEQRAWDRLPLDAINPRYIDKVDIPIDKTFRLAWTLDLSVDMQKARNIWRDKMRRARAPLLSALDVDYQRADEMGDSESKILVASKKQELRDVTSISSIEDAQTPDALKEIWPECLGELS